MVLWAAGPQAGAAATIMPHLAVYKLSLGKTRGTGGVTHASGRIEFKWREGCDGWTVNQRTHLILTSAQGLDFESGWVLNAWESKDGLSYRFSVQRAHGGAAPEEVRGKARLQALGEGGVVTYSEPEKSSLSLPSGTLFPTRYSEELIDAASRSEFLFWRQVFDGSAEDGLFGVNATLSRSLPADVAPSFDSPLIRGVESWRMRLAYFGSSEQQAEPEHEQGQRVYANGVVDELEFDYNDFAIKGALERLERLGKACGAMTALSW
jgi:hypothetical protein